MYCRRSAIGLVLAGGLLLAVAAAAKPITSPKGYQITPAPGWKVNTTGLMGTDVVIYTDPASGFAANVNILVKKVSPDETVDTVMPGISATNRGTLTAYNQISENITTVSGARAISLIAKYRLGTPPRAVRVHQVLALKNDTVYLFTCTALDANYAKYDPAFAAMLRSIRWTK